MPIDSPRAPSLAEAARVWLKIGLLSFGGPAGQIAMMHRDLVEQRRWIGERRFLHALNYCMLLPGPEAQQLATYIGWLLHRTLGGLIAGLLFVLPGALVMLGLSIVYVFYRDVPLIGAAFLGIKAAVLAIVIEAGLRIGRRALRGRVMVAIAVSAFLCLFLLKLPFPLVVFGAGVAGWLGHRVAPAMISAGTAVGRAEPREDHAVVDAMFARGELAHAVPSRRSALRVVALWLPLWLAPVALLWWLRGPGDVFVQIGSFFSVMAVVTFGGAYAVLSYVAQAAVETYGWLFPGEMLDGLGLAETTPGPLILVLQFVGFLAAWRVPGALDPIVAGTLGALLTLWVTFVPCFFWIFLGAPYVELLRGHQGLSAALGAITAAVVGVIMNLAVWFALHVLFRRIDPVVFGPIRIDLPVLSSFDWRAAILAFAAAFALLRLRIPMLPVLAGSAVAGMILSRLG